MDSLSEARVKLSPLFPLSLLSPFSPLSQLLPPSPSEFHGFLTLGSSSGPENNEKSSGLRIEDQIVDQAKHEAIASIKHLSTKDASSIRLTLSISMSK